MSASRIRRGSSPRSGAAVCPLVVSLSILFISTSLAGTSNEPRPIAGKPGRVGPRFVVLEEAALPDIFAGSSESLRTPRLVVVEAGRLARFIAASISARVMTEVDTMRTPG